MRGIMKKIILSCCVSLIFSLSFCQLSSAEKLRMAILEEVDNTVTVPVIAVTNLRDFVRESLNLSGKVDIVSRDEGQLKKLFEEQKFSSERIGRVDVNDEKKAEYGKIAGIEYVMLLKN